MCNQLDFHQSRSVCPLLLFHLRKIEKDKKKYNKNWISITEVSIVYSIVESFLVVLFRPWGPNLILNDIETGSKQIVFRFENQKHRNEPQWPTLIYVNKAHLNKHLFLDQTIHVFCPNQQWSQLQPDYEHLAADCQIELTDSCPVLYN